LAPSKVLRNGRLISTIDDLAPAAALMSRWQNARRAIDYTMNQNSTGRPDDRGWQPIPDKNAAGWLDAFNVPHLEIRTIVRGDVEAVAEILCASSNSSILTGSI
jgi:hypothetical protein